MDYQMNVSEKWQVVINISISNDEFLVQYKKTLQDFAKNVKMDGFRPGKIPLNMLESRYKSDIENEAIEKIIPHKLSHIIIEKKLNPISRPFIRKVEKKLDSTLCEVAFDIFPDTEIKDYSEIKIDAKKKEVTDDIIEKNISLLKNLYAKIEDKDGELEKGDIAIVDLNVFDSEGSEMEDLKYSDYSIEMTEGEILPVFIEKMLGKKKGEKIEFTYKYADDYQDAVLKGKDVNIKINIKDTKKKILPEINDEFAKSMGLESYSQLVDLTKKRLESDFAKEYELDKEEKVINFLIEKNPFEVPESLVELHLESIVESVKKSNRQEIPDDEKTRELYKNYAFWRAKREVILSRIAMQEKLSATDEEIDKEIENIRKHPNIKVRELADREETKDDIERDIVFSKTKDFVNSKVVFIEANKKEGAE